MLNFLIVCIFALVITGVILHIFTFLCPLLVFQESIQIYLYYLSFMFYVRPTMGDGPTINQVLDKGPSAREVIFLILKYLKNFIDEVRYDPSTESFSCLVENITMK
jgi:hypothetical protein